MEGESSKAAVAGRRKWDRREVGGLWRQLLPFLVFGLWGMGKSDE